MADPDALGRETADVLAQLIRFNTVNPPGDERACQEWLAGYLRDAGLEVELDGATPERPNLVARLRGDADGPVLGYLSHVDTVLADAGDWEHDPWGGEIHDGFLWGRGALDMKSQTAAEAVAIAALARSGRRPARGEVRLISVVDEEVGGAEGAIWLCRERPDLARVDYLLNEGGGQVMPYGDRRLFGICCAEKGTFRFRVTARGVAGHASVPGFGDNALVKLAPVLQTLATERPAYDVTDAPRQLLEALGEDPADPAAAIASVAATEPRLATMVEPTLRVTAVPTVISGSPKINVIPARAELLVDARVPPGMDGEPAMRRIREVLGDHALEIEFTEQVTGNASPFDSPLADAITAWIGEQEPDALLVPVVLPAFTDSRTFRDAFPDCVAYGFFPQRHQSLYETWPLIHSANERIDVRDLAFAASFFHDLPERLLP
ncbi:MAG TPA: M20/M25/M40 family metallo-hydrolase [Solirubrobacteraceae bacterium]|nr:M20/M25/M40 family metallo-hydrolase [Solirubrobacteraceae bacterium]